MTDLDQQLQDLVTANRILAREEVVDAFGHVSIRHPEHPVRYILSQSRAPELVDSPDLMEYTLEGEPLDQQGRTMYSERPIHGGVYEARPDVMAVVHNHSPAVLPFGVTSQPLRPMFHLAAIIGPQLPVWDIRDNFQDTSLLVTTMEQGRDLAATLGDGRAALMRGHGCVVAGNTLKEAVMASVYLQSQRPPAAPVPAPGRGEIPLARRNRADVAEPGKAHVPGPRLGIPGPSAPGGLSELCFA